MTVPIGAPIVSAPDSGVSVTESTVEVVGLVFAPSDVEVRRGGASIETATPDPGPFEIRAFPFELASGELPAAPPILSPDGTRAAFVSADPSFGSQRLVVSGLCRNGICDSSESFTLDDLDRFFTSAMAFSPDGHWLAVISEDTFVSDSQLVLIDLDSRRLTAPTWGFGAGLFNPRGPLQWSPDSEKVLLVSGASGAREVVSAEVQTTAVESILALAPDEELQEVVARASSIGLRVFTLIGSTLGTPRVDECSFGSPGFVWTCKTLTGSAQLQGLSAAVRSDDTSIVGVASDNGSGWEPLLLGTSGATWGAFSSPPSLAVSKDGEQIVWLEETAEWVTFDTSQGTQTATTFGTPLTDVTRLEWHDGAPWARLGAEGSLARVLPLWTFSVAASLVPGTNPLLLRSSSADGTPGNETLLEVTSTVAFDDLVISVGLTPEMPSPDVPALAHVTVRNDGNRGTSISTTVRITLFGSSSRSVTVPVPTPVRSGSSVDFFVPISVTGLSGAQTLVATVDPGGIVSDVNRTNNVATLEFDVAPRSGPSVSIEATRTGDRLDAFFTAFNPGVPVSVVVQTGLETQQGNVVMAGADESVQLSSASTHTFERTFDLTALPTGDYVVVGRVLIAGVTAFTARESFSVVRPVAGTVEISSSASTYGPGQLSVLNARVTNTSSVQPLTGASIDLVVRDATGVEVVAATLLVSGLAPGASIVRSFSFPVSTLSPGDFEATASLLGGGALLSSAATTFRIQGAHLFEGLVSARAGPSALQGQPLVVDATLRNTGNAAALGVELAVTEIDSTSGSIVGVQTATLGAMSPAASQTVSLTLPAPSQLRPHALVLSARTAGQPFAPVASVTIGVLDGLGPVLVVEAPAVGGVVGSPVTVRVRATDVSGVARVQVAADAQPAEELVLVDGSPIDGAWELSLASLASGPHTVSLTAVDMTGALANPVVVGFDIDADAPVVAIGGVSTNGEYATSPSITFSATDQSSVTITAFLDGVVFAPNGSVADGAHELRVVAVDAAGNRSVRSVSFFVDSRPPVIQLSAPPAGAVVAPPVTVSYLVLDSTSAAVVASIDGAPFTDAATITSAGQHAVAVTATDRLGNTATETRSFSIVTGTLRVDISGVVDGAIERGPLTPTVTISGEQSSSVLLNGSPFVSGTAVTMEGQWVLTAVATDGANTISRTVTFIIDMTPPVLALTGVDDGAVVRSPRALSFAATDLNLGPVASTLDGAPVTSGALVVGERPHVWVVTASDRAGNTTSETRTFILDDTPPVVQIVGVFEQQVSNSALTPAVTVTDANPGAVSIELDGAAFISGTSVVAEGDHLLRVIAADAAANRTQVERRFAIDTTPPVISVTGVATGATVRGPVTLQFSANDTRLFSVTAVLDGASTTSGVVVDREGLHELRVTAVDSAGNTSSLTHAFTIDRTPPAITVSGVVQGQVSALDLTPVVSAIDGTLTSLMLDGQPFVSGTVVSAEGPHLLVALAEDAAGNTAAVQVAFDVDKTPPLLLLSGVVEGAVRAGPVTLAFSATDRNALTVTSVLDSMSFPGGTVSTEGSHHWSVDAVDAAGNRAHQERRFTLDFTPPGITVSGVTDGDVGTSDVTISVSVTDLSLQTQLVTVDGVPFVSPDTVSTEGAHLLRVDASDAAGHTSTREVRFTIDRTAPVLQLVGVTDGATLNTPVTLSSSASDLTTVTLSSTVDGVSFTSGDAVSTEGIHLWVVSATDAAGNTSTQQRSFVLDFTAPVITVTGVVDGEVRSGDVTPVITSTGASSVLVTLDGAPFVSGTTVTVEGTFSLAVTATDLAGNRATSTVTFTIDRSSPVVIITGITEGAVVQGPVTLTFSATDAVGIGSLVGRLDGASVQSPVTVSGEGPQVLTVEAIDLAGNRSTASRSFTIDRTPPVITITGVVDGQAGTTPVTPVFAASDPSSVTLTATVNGAAFSSGTTVSAVGTWTLTVTAVDAAGNQATTTVHFAITSSAGVCRNLRLRAINRTGTGGGLFDATASPTPALSFLLPSAVTLLRGGSSGTQVSFSFANGSGPLTTCRYAGGPSTASLVGCTPSVSTGTVLTATGLSLSVTSSGSGATTEAAMTLVEQAPCDGQQMVPSFNYAVCAFGNGTVRGSAIVRGSVATQRSLVVTGNGHVQGDVVVSSAFSCAGSGSISGNAYVGGTATLSCGLGAPHGSVAVTPPPQPCECGYDLAARLLEADRNNDNNLLRAEPLLAPFFSAGALHVRNANIQLPQGRYFLSALSTRNGRIDVAPGETVELFVSGNLELDRSPIAPLGGGALVIVSGANSTAGDQVNIKTQDATLRLYAPLADVTLEGRTLVRGALACRDLTLQGNLEVELAPGPQASPPPLTCQ